MKNAIIMATFMNVVFLYKILIIKYLFSLNIYFFTTPN